MVGPLSVLGSGIVESFDPKIGASRVDRWKTWAALSFILLVLVSRALHVYDFGDGILWLAVSAFFTALGYDVGHKEASTLE